MDRGRGDTDNDSEFGSRNAMDLNPSMANHHADNDDHHNIPAANVAQPSTGEHHHLLGAARTYLSRPRQELLEVLREASAFKLFWYDMRLRPHAAAHRFLLISGVWLFVVVITSCFVMEFDPVVEHEYIHYVILERCITGIAQLLLTSRAVFVENRPLLLIANLNAVGLLTRAAMKEMMHDVPNFILLALLIVGFITHVATTYVAIKGGMERFSFYMISNDPAIRRMYDYYLTYTALALLDLECSILATASIFFFMETRWYWFILFGVFIFFAVANGSLLRHVIRTEGRREAIIPTLPTYIFLPIGIIIAYAYEDFVEVHIGASLKPLVVYGIVTFLLVRIALFVAVAKCFKSFGNGMKEAFANAKDSVDFVREEATNKYAWDIDAFFAQASDARMEAGQPHTTANYQTI
jgi:hypothetical protein